MNTLALGIAAYLDSLESHEIGASLTASLYYFIADLGRHGVIPASAIWGDVIQSACAARKMVAEKLLKEALDADREAADIRQNLERKIKLMQLAVNTAENDQNFNV